MTVTKRKGVLNVNLTEQGIPERKNSQVSAASVAKAGAAKSPHGCLDPNVDDMVPCRICDRNVGRGESLQCDRCMSWVHMKKCSKLTQEEFDFLTDHPDCSVQWYCNTCKTEIVSGPDGQDDTVARQGAKIDTLIEVVRTMQTQMSVMQNQMTVLVELVKERESKRAPDLNTDTQIQTHVSEMLEDQREKEEKKNNIILFNVPEVETNEELTDREEMEVDVENIKDVLSVVYPNVDALGLSVSQENVIRLGRTKKDNINRPVKVMLKDNSSKGKIFVNSWKLRDHDTFNRVGISSDKTKKEMEKYKELKFQLQKKKEETGEDWMIYKDTIIKRADKPARTAAAGGVGGAK